jgi:NhaP-type Na+/H+ or K+/H+ antiporter
VRRNRERLADSRPAPGDHHDSILEFHTVTVERAIASGLVLWSVVAERLERWNITAPIVFVAVGLLLANGPTRLVDVRLGGAGIAELAEITLAVVLFGDAARVSLADVRHDLGLPSRLLLIGLPLTMVLGTVAARLLFPSLSWWVCAVIGAAVAPTDAALGAAIVNDERVPARIRRVLNVESGLNDGIVTPFVKFFIVAAVIGTSLETESEGGALAELAIGVAGGAAIGALGGWLMSRASAAGIGAKSYRKVGVTALAILSYAALVEIGGNGFVAAFVAGLAYGAVTTDERDESLEFTHQSAELMSMIVWFFFGAVMVPTLQDASWQEVLFAVGALTVVRMVPVAVALLGTGFDAATVGVLGWFGPRGLASVVFALLALEGLAPADAQRAVTIITATVLMSVVAHGVSAGPIAARYGATVRSAR